MNVLDYYIIALNYKKIKDRKRALLLYLVDKTFHFNKPNYSDWSIPTKTIEEWCELSHCSIDHFRKIRRELRQKRLIIEEKSYSNKRILYLKLYFLSWWETDITKHTKKMEKDLIIMLRYKVKINRISKKELIILNDLNIRRE